MSSRGLYFPDLPFLRVPSLQMLTLRNHGANNILEYSHEQRYNLPPCKHSGCFHEFYLLWVNSYKSYIAVPYDTHLTGWNHTYHIPNFSLSVGIIPHHSINNSKANQDLHNLINVAQTKQGSPGTAGLTNPLNILSVPYESLSTYHIHITRIPVQHLLNELAWSTAMRDLYRYCPLSHINTTRESSAMEGKMSRILMGIFALPPTFDYSLPSSKPSLAKAVIINLINRELTKWAI